MDSQKDVDAVDVACMQRLCGDVNKTLLLYMLDDSGRLALLPVNNNHTSATSHSQLAGLLLPRQQVS